MSQKVKMPWLAQLQKLGLNNELEFPSQTMYEKLREAATRYPDYTAIDFMGKRIRFSQLIELIDRLADSLVSQGVRAGDVVAICLPNIPQNVVAFYAVNRVGAKACMIHPLSSPPEVETVLRETGARVLFSLDMLYPNLHPLIRSTEVRIVVLCRMGDYLPIVKSLGFAVQNVKKSKAVAREVGALDFTLLIKNGRADTIYARAGSPEDCAVILYSGGTSSGTPKGIMLSHNNFNALAKNIATFVEGVQAGQSMLTILPLFHGFGLGICVHAILSAGLTSILVPQFSGKVFIDTIRKKKPNYIAGVPSMYETLTRRKEAEKIDYKSFLLQAFCGGDSVPTELKVRFNNFMEKRGCSVKLREGYGLTETVTAATISPAEKKVRSTVGFPFPGMYAKIVEVGTQKEVPYGTDGEICLSGAQVMLGYLDAPEETAKSLQTHADGRVWLHTGDMGSMDEEGFIFFRQRIKRIIKCKAFPVYPSVVEDAILSFEGVARAAVLGVPDAYAGQKVKAYVVMDDPIKKTPEMERAILVHCEKLLNKWSVPSEIVFRDELPLTKVGKVSIPALEKEELESRESTPAQE